MAIHAVASTVQWAWRPARDDEDARNRRRARSMYRSAAVSAGLGATLSLVAARSAGKSRLVCITGAVVTLVYAGWTVIVGGAAGQFARSVQAQARRSAG